MTDFQLVYCLGTIYVFEIYTYANEANHDTC